MKFDDYLKMVKNSKSHTSISSFKKDFKNSDSYDEDMRSPENLPLEIRSATTITLEFVEKYLIEIVKRNKISTAVGRLLKEWFIEKTNLTSQIKETNGLEIDIDDLELLLSRMDKIESGTIDITNS